jgi:hypothetical protein
MYYSCQSAKKSKGCVARKIFSTSQVSYLQVKLFCVIVIKQLNIV